MQLNAQQQEILNLLHKFRFGTDTLFCDYFGKDASLVLGWFKDLNKQGLVNTHHTGDTLVYYLTPKGIRRLQEFAPSETLTQNHSDTLVNPTPYLSIFSLFNQLRARYPSTLKFLTSANLHQPRHHYLPHPLPAAFVSIMPANCSEPKRFFIDFIQDTAPTAELTELIKHYIQYANSGTWTKAIANIDLPKTLFMCESQKIQTRLEQQIQKIPHIKPDFIVATKKDIVQQMVRPDVVLK